MTSLLDVLDRIAPGPTPRRRLDRAVRVLAGWLLLLAVAGLVGVGVASHATYGLALAGAVLLLGVWVADPVLIAVVVLPGTLLVQRVGGSSTNLSAADLLGFLGGAVCLLLVEWRDAPNLKHFLRGVVWYQAVLVVVVVVHPFRSDVIEWFHRFSYTGGSALIGWVVAARGRARTALRAYLWASSVLALLTMEHAVTLHFAPAQWGVYQKNAIGAVMWVAVVVAQLNPPWLALSRREAWITKLLCLAALLASQSRQSIILLVLAMAVAVLRNPATRRRSKSLVLAAVPLVAVVYVSLSTNAKVNPKFNSVSIRFGQIGAAIHVWHLSPVLGEGMRFYYLPQFVSVTAPPNVLVDNLASTGVLGSLAFFFLVAVTLAALWRLPLEYGTLGLVVLLGHYVDGLFDTFWIGASTIGPFLLAGISLGLADARRRDGPADPDRAPPPAAAVPAVGRRPRRLRPAG
jgi:hypothetical protein